MKKSIYTGKLKIEEITPGVEWMLLEDLTYEVSYKGSNKIIKVPKGFITDGATIPFWAKNLIAVWGTYGRATVIHDYLYQLLLSNTPHKHALTRYEADRIFLEAMKPLGTHILLRYFLYIAVRIGGWFYLNLDK